MLKNTRTARILVQILLYIRKKKNEKKYLFE